MAPRSLGVVLTLALMGTAASRAEAGQAAPGDTLVAMSRARLQAVDAGDRAAYAAGLDPDGVFVDEDAVVRTGAVLLDEVRPLPPGYVGHLELQHPTVRITDGVGVVTYDIAEDLALFGQRLRTRYHTTDVYQRTGDAWRLIASHTSVIPSELPRITLAPGRLADYVGAYRLGDGPVGRVTLEGDRLLWRREGRDAQELVPTGVDRFAQAGRPRGERLFRRTPAGRVDAFVDRRDNNDLVWVRVAAAPSKKA
jgi:hypothetical protein